MVLMSEAEGGRRVRWRRGELGAVINSSSFFCHAV